MSLADVLPGVKALSRTEKVQLIQLVAQELDEKMCKFIAAGQPYPIWSPDESFAAAAVMLKVLEEEKAPDEFTAPI
jgi:hypothetical protein